MHSFNHSYSWVTVKVVTLQNKLLEKDQREVEKTAKKIQAKVQAYALEIDQSWMLFLNTSLEYSWVQHWCCYDPPTKTRKKPHSLSILPLELEHIQLQHRNGFIWFHMISRISLAKHVMDMVCAVSLCKSPSPANSWLWPFGYPLKPAHAISGRNPNQQSAVIVSGEITHSCSFSEVIFRGKKMGKNTISKGPPGVAFHAIHQPVQFLTAKSCTSHSSHCSKRSQMSEAWRIAPRDCFTSVWSTDLIFVH